MGLYLNPGNEAFQISANSEIYVDKSELIAFTNQRLGQEKRFLCVSRPRRFGKSMAANMLCAYYSRGCDSKKMFQSLKIAQNETFEQHLNQYQVLYFEMQRFLSRAGSPEKLVSYLESIVLEELRMVYSDIIGEKEEHLPQVLEKIYEKDKTGFVFIIDEWDCMFRETKEKEETQRAYLDFLRDLLKGQTYVKLAYMTGILPIKKYGTHSALNMFDEFSMTDQRRLSEYVGFTEEEVRNLCRKYEMDFEETKRWYDGYCFKRTRHVYNPKSIVDAMIEEEFRSYWTSTETYEALKVYIDMNFDGLKDSIIAMLGGVACKIDAGTFQNDMTNFESKDDVLTLLVHLGYLAYREEQQEVFIPNEEVRAEFLRAIKQSGWKNIISSIVESEKLLEDTLRQDAEAVAKAIDKVHTEQTSILSYNNENSLSCVITLAYYSAQKDYTLIREMPTGKGFADIVFLPRRYTDRPAMIVELKWNQSEYGAIEQIRKKEYIKALEEYSGKVLLVGINYDKKSKKHNCVIEINEKE